jgi:two-component system, cell cycle sensor histidine kinase and response regulator CckA
MSETMANKSEAAKRGDGEIYVVDDEPMLLELAMVILEPLGYRIKTFRDPETAVQEFTSAQPHPLLIITDYAMHTMNGLELIEACRRIEPGQKTLMLSGTVGPDIYHDSPIQPDRFLAKPYQAKQLVDMVRAMLAA